MRASCSFVEESGPCFESEDLEPVELVPGRRGPYCPRHRAVLEGSR